MRDSQITGYKNDTSENRHDILRLSEIMRTKKAEFYISEKKVNDQIKICLMAKHIKG